MSSFTAEDLSRTGIDFPDKAAHFIEYALLGASLLFALAPAHPRRAGGASLLAAIALAIVFGGLDELHQSLVPGRDPSIADLIADATGALAGSLLSYGLGLWGQAVR